MGNDGQAIRRIAEKLRVGRGAPAAAPVLRAAGEPHEGHLFTRRRLQPRGDRLRRLWRVGGRGFLSPRCGLPSSAARGSTTARARDGGDAADDPLLDAPSPIAGARRRRRRRRRRLRGRRRARGGAARRRREAAAAAAPPTRRRTPTRWRRRRARRNPRGCWRGGGPLRGGVLAVGPAERPPRRHRRRAAGAPQPKARVGCTTGCSSLRKHSGREAAAVAEAGMRRLHRAASGAPASSGATRRSASTRTR